jgi:plasmid maintenance system killer protein
MKMDVVAMIEWRHFNDDLNYKVLHGEKEGLGSIRINAPYRIEFKITHMISETIVTIWLTICSWLHII